MGFLGTVWDYIKRGGYLINRGGNWVLGKIFPTERKGWIDEAKNGLNTRQEILFRDSVSCQVNKNDQGKVTITGTLPFQ